MRFIALLDYPVKYYKVAIYHKDAPTFQLILLPCLSGAGEIAFSEPQNAVSLAFRMLNQNLFTKQKGMLKFYDLHLNQIKFHVVSMHYRKHRTCISRASSKDNDPGLQISNGQTPVALSGQIRFCLDTTCFLASQILTVVTLVIMNADCTVVLL